jgi:hypothetical protein
VAATVGSPPAAGTRISGPVQSGVNTISFSESHAPPTPVGVAQMTLGDASPPRTRIFISFPRTKNPTHSPSGEKNGP